MPFFEKGHYERTPGKIPYFPYKCFHYDAENGQSYPIAYVGDTYHGARKSGRAAHSSANRRHEICGHFASIGTGPLNGMAVKAYSVSDKMSHRDHEQRQDFKYQFQIP